MSVEDQIQKARNRPIDGRYPLLAEQIRYLMGYFTESGRPYLTTRMAARKTNVNHATISTMLRGDRPSEDSIRRFALGLGGDVNSLLTAAGYLPDDFDQKAKRDDKGNLVYRTRLFLPTTVPDEQSLEALTFRKFANPARFGLMSHPIVKEGTYGYTLAMEVWETIGLGLGNPILPYTDNFYHYCVIGEYVNHLDAADSSLRALEDHYASLFKLCLAYATYFQLIEEGNHFPNAEMLSMMRESSPNLYKRIAEMSKQLGLATVAWYELRKNSSRRLPEIPDLLELLRHPIVDIDSEFKKFEERYSHDELMLFANFSTLLNDNGFWDKNRLSDDIREGFRVAVNAHDVEATYVASVFLGLYHAMARETEYGGISAPFMMTTSVPFAQASIVALISWWQTTDYNPQLTFEKIWK